MNSEELKESRNNFLQQMVDETGLTKAQVKKILAERGITRYDPDKKASYRAIILADAELWKSVETKLAETPEPAKCLFPDCDGNKISRGRGSTSWTCTKGGLRHYLAYWTAKVTGQDPKEVLITLTNAKHEQEKRDRATRKLWYEEMQRKEEKASP